MKSNFLNLEFKIERGDFRLAGEASSKIKKTLENIGLHHRLIRRISVATYEAEMNMVFHSLGGMIRVVIEQERVVIYIEDKGPGIEDIDLAMTEGYSTANDEMREMGFGAGMGLPNIKKCSDDMHIESKVGHGTKIILTFKND